METRLRDGRSRTTDGAGTTVGPSTNSARVGGSSSAVENRGRSFRGRRGKNHRLGGGGGGKPERYTRKKPKHGTEKRRTSILFCKGEETRALKAEKKKKGDCSLYLPVAQAKQRYIQTRPEKTEVIISLNGKLDTSGENGIVFPTPEKAEVENWKRNPNRYGGCLHRRKVLFR